MDDTGPALPPALGRLRVALDTAYLHASRQLGITTQQAELLCAAMNPTTVGELAHRLRCDRTNVTKHIDRASERGLINRRKTDQDARVTVVELTPKGKHLAQEFITTLQAQTDNLRSMWSPRKQQQAVHLLNQIADALDPPH